MSVLYDVLNYHTDQIDRAEGERARDELAQLHARIDALENDIICAFCGAHYKADDVPPQHYMTCEQSPLVQRIAEQARQIEEARELRTLAVSLVDALGYYMDADQEPQVVLDAEMALGNWLAANPAQQEAQDAPQ